MRARALTAVVVLASCLPPLHAQVRDFPYEARVVVDEVYVRSGSGNNHQYYPTGKLARDATVTVRRHEPGGWLMIDPPEGSFSWIPAKYVDAAGDTGTVREDNVVAFVGSEFGDESGVWQRSLRAGEQVTILGERTIDTARGRQAMLQIVPPAREYRWIPGSAVIPVDDAVRRQLDNDPYALPSQARRDPKPASPAAPDAAATAGPVDTPEVQPSRQLARLQQIRTEQQALRDIDRRFRDMVLQKPSGWDLHAIEQDYRDLQERATWKPVAGQIDLRYPAIERYRKRKAEYEDFQRLTSQTEQRDAELLAAQTATTTALTSGPGTNFGGTVAAVPPETVPSTGLPPNLAALLTGVPPQATGSSGGFPDIAAGPGDFTLPEDPAEVPTAAWAADPTPPTNSTTDSARSRYVGAGILTRSTEDDDSTSWRLTSPDGRTLARLEPEDGVDLDRYEGQAVGLHGSRWYEDSLKSDYIEVSGLEPVRIRR